MSNYPPGVTGNEPQITGEWPCARCAGTNSSACWMCNGSGLHPEDAPSCPGCGSERTLWVDDLSPWRLRIVAAAYGIRLVNRKGWGSVARMEPLQTNEAIMCRTCKQVSQ